MATILWRIKSYSPQAIQCELDSPSEGLYRIRIVRDRNPDPFFEHAVSDRRDVLRSSAVIHQEFMLRGWRDMPFEPHADPPRRAGERDR